MRTSSSAKAGSRWRLCQRSEIRMTIFSLPHSRVPGVPAAIHRARFLRKRRAGLGETQSVRSFNGCCASADKQSARSMAQSARTMIVLFMFSLLYPLDSPRHFTLVPSHLITLSARASTFGGIVSPICLAAFRLMINSNFVGCSTGRSAGLAPLKSCPHKWRRGDTSR